MICFKEYIKSGGIKNKHRVPGDQYYDLPEYVHLWHRRLRNVSLPVVRQVLQQQNYRQIPVSFRGEVCDVTKLTKKTYDQYRTQG